MFSRATCAALLAGFAASVATFSNERDAHALFKDSSVRYWPGGVVPVCFTAELQSKPNFDRFYSVLRYNVENTWGREANIRFTGWGTCPSVWPAQTAVLYFKTNGFNAQMGSNPTGSTSFAVDFNYPGNDTPARWADVVVHEFGHLLGFDHEMDRGDNPYFANHSLGCSQVDGGWPQPGNEVDITPYDQNSIMNYCGIGSPTVATLDPSGSDLGWFQPISAWDVAGAQSIYGRKPAGSLVGPSGRCVNVVGDNLAWGTQLSAYDCGGADNDTWSRALDGHDLTLQSLLGGWQRMAIDVPNAALTGFFTALADYPPNNSIAQQLTFTGQQWKAYGDMCVVADSTSPNSGVRVKTCGDTPSLERWDFEPTGRIRLSGTNQCVNVPHGSASIGNPMQTYPCSTGTPYYNEVYQFTARGEIAYGGLCMNVWRGNMASGSPIALYGCNGAPNESFHTTGPVRGEGGQCLSTFMFPDPQVATNGAPVGLRACGGTSDQEWDYYFLPR